LTFSTKHAFQDFPLEMFCFATSDKCVDATDVEIGKMAGRTGSSATSATDAKVDRWLMHQQIFRYAFIVAVIVDRFVTKNFIAEIYCHFVFF
jgi:hypothetical protein